MSLVPAFKPRIQADFIQSVSNWTGGKKKINVKETFEDIFMVAVDRGLNDEEFSLLLRFIAKGPLGVQDRVKFLRCIVPSSHAPADAMQRFLTWFISNYMNIDSKLAMCILQWIIGLLDYDMLNLSTMDWIYFELYNMLDIKSLVKHVCTLLCRLTKPQDVKGSMVMQVTNKLRECGDSDDKFLVAVLNVFRAYKPHLLHEGVKKVDVEQILKTAPQSMDSIIKVIYKKHKQLPTRDLGIFQMAVPSSTEQRNEAHNRMSELIPFPAYDVTERNDTHFFPKSIEEAFYKFGRVPVPLSAMSLLRDEVGLFLIMYKGPNLQNRISTKVLSTLQAALIDQSVEASEGDKEFLLTRVYQLQVFMQNGLQFVSIFLSGYLLDWDGLDYRSHILSLIEWAAFDSFQELSLNVLRPLYMLFVSYDVTMKRQIIQAVTNLIKNMYITDVKRSRRGLPHPFLGRAPAWTQDPLSMISPLVSWVERLIKTGLCLVPDNSNLLMECVSFYEMMNVVESDSRLPVWTVISKGVVYHGLFNYCPNILGKICRLLMIYHKEFLPRLRVQQPEFYNECRDKINLTSKYTQELLNFLWNGQAVSRKEDGIIFREISDETLAAYNTSILDSLFDVENNINFMPFILLERAKNGTGFLKNRESFLALLDYYAEDITAFIKYFSPNLQHFNDDQMDM